MVSVGYPTDTFFVWSSYKSKPFSGNSLFDGNKKYITLEQIQRLIRHSIEDASRYDFAICLIESDQMIGKLSILDIEPNNRKACFRIALNTIELTGKGFGTEATQLILKFVFEELKLHRLQLEVFCHNERGIKADENWDLKKKVFYEIR